jgi:putative membrane protein
MRHDRKSHAAGVELELCLWMGVPARSLNEEDPMRIIAGAAICLLFALPAAAESLTEKSGINSLVGVSPSTQDFVTEAGISDMFEIQSSKLAVQRASDQATKGFANQMITDHGKTSSELKSMVEKGTVKANLPTGLDSSHQSMLDKLKGLNGSDFTKQYHDDQVSGHKDAVDLFKRYAKGGRNEALKSWAGKTLPTLEHHLDMANNLDK